LRDFLQGRGFRLRYFNIVQGSWGLRPTAIFLRASLVFAFSLAFAFASPLAVAPAFPVALSIALGCIGSVRARTR
jgi:hypothetical protein